MNHNEKPIFTNKIFELLASISLILFSVKQYVDFILSFQQRNLQYAKGICCGFTDPVFSHIYTLETVLTNQLDFTKGYASVISAFLFNIQGSEETGLLNISHGAFVLSLLLVYLWGILRKAPLMGAVVAYLFSVTPILIFSSLRWDVFILAIPLILLALILVPFSRGFTKIIPTILFCLISWCAAFWSSRETDNFILLLSFGSIAFGHWMQALWKGKDQWGRISRVKSTWRALAACCLLLFWIFKYIFITSPEGISYYFSEAGQSSTSEIEGFSWMHFSAYWGHLYWRGLGQSFGSLFICSAGWLILRRKLDWATAFAFLIPLLILSMLPKKNFYYVYGIWGLIPLIIGMAVYYLPKNVRWFAIIGVIWFGQEQLSLRQSRSLVLPSDHMYGRIFQTSDHNISLEPIYLGGVDSIAKIIMENMPTMRCEHARWIADYVQLNNEEIEVRIKQKYPCTIIKRYPKMKLLNEVSAFLINAQDLLPIDKNNLEQQSFQYWGSVSLEGEKQIEIWGKSVILERNIQTPVEK